MIKPIIAVKGSWDYLGIIFPGTLVAAIIESTHFYFSAR